MYIKDMLKMKLKSLIAIACGIVITLFFVAACKNGSPANDKGVQPPAPKVDSNNATLLKINNQIFSIPSPIQTALLVKKSGYAYIWCRSGLYFII